MPTLEQQFRKPAVMPQPPTDGNCHIIYQEGINECAGSDDLDMCMAPFTKREMQCRNNLESAPGKATEKKEVKFGNTFKSECYEYKLHKTQDG
jgi:hypothetical protein